MAGLADFDLHAPGQLGGEPKARAKNFQDERITDADQFQPATDTDSERLQALRFFVLRLHAAHHGADTQRQFVQTDERKRLGNGCQNKNKIVFLRVQSKSNRLVSTQLLAACDLLSADCTTQFG